MRALYKSAPGPGHLELEDRPVPVLNETDNVLIRVQACAVCGMDHRISHGSYPCTPPFIMGHELVGTVEDVFGNVSSVKKGDRVTIQPHLYSCGICAVCKAGFPQFCQDKRTVGIDRDGAMTDLVAVPASCVHHVPEEIPDNLACILEPFSMIYGNIVPAIRREQAKTVVIIGAGQVGIMALTAAKSIGCQWVGISGTDRDVNERFPAAQKLGADETINSFKTSLPDRILEVTGGVGADIILDASGSEKAISQAIQAVKKGGLILAMGMTRSDTISIPWDICLKKAIRIQFFMQSNYAYMDEAIQAFAHPYTDLSWLITKEMPLSQWKELFDYMDTHDTLKNILYID